MHASMQPVHAREAHFRRIRADVHQRARRCRQVQSGPLLLGGFDLAVTRFSGRRAPPREGPAFMRGRRARTR